MKGPGNRAKFPIFRTWECPKCGRKSRTAVQVAHQRCTCDPAVWMRLVEEPRKARKP